MKNEMFVMDGNVELSEEFSSFEEIIDCLGTSYAFIDVKVNNIYKRLTRGIDY